MPGSAHRAALPTQMLDSGNSDGVGPPGARPLDSDPCARGLQTDASGYVPAVHRLQGEGTRMPMWVWILIIVLLVLLLFGGIGYGRRGSGV